jgi:hypothetical protein
MGSRQLYRVLHDPDQPDDEICGSVMTFGRKSLQSQQPSLSFLHMPSNHLQFGRELSQPASDLLD